jgi:WD40 repeat protein
MLSLFSAFSQKSFPVKLESKDQYINCVSFSAGGSIIAYGDGNDVRIKSLDKNSSRSVIAGGHHDKVLSLDISSDSSLIVSGGRDNLIIVNDISGRIYKVLDYHTGKVTAVKFDPSGKYIYSGSTDKRVVCFSLDENRVIFDKAIHTSDILSIDISNDGRILATGGADKMILILDARTGDEIQNLGRQGSWVRCVKFTSDNSELAAGMDNGNIFIWKVKNPGDIFLMEKRKSSLKWITSIDFLHDNSSYTFSGENGVVGSRIFGKGYRKRFWKPVRMIKIQPPGEGFFNVAVATYGKGIYLAPSSFLMK